MRFTPAFLSGLLLLAAVPALAQPRRRMPPPPPPPAAAATEETLPIGSPMPFAGRPLIDVSDQHAVYLDSVAGPNGLLVMFSCNTCPYVVKSQARTLEMVAFAKCHEIPVVIINSNEAQRDADDSPVAMKNYAGAQGYTVPYVLDPGSEAANRFGATRTPEVFLFNKDRRLVYKGAMEDNPASPAESKKFYLKDAITNLVAGKPIDPLVTKSVGCSIKRR